MQKAVFGLVALVAAISLLVIPQTSQGSATSELHPIVGSWRLISDEEGVNVTAFYTFGSDGTLISTDLSGTTWHGAWRPEADDRVAFLIEAANPDSTGMGQTGVFPVEAGLNEIPFSGGHLERIVVDISDGPTVATVTP